MQEVPGGYFAVLRELQLDKIAFAKSNKFTDLIDELEGELELYDYINELAREHLVYRIDKTSCVTTTIGEFILRCDKQQFRIFKNVYTNLPEKLRKYMFFYVDLKTQQYYFALLDYYFKPMGIEP